jgi:hypothetical protein
VNDGSDTGSADVVVKAVPSGVDPATDPGEVAELGRQSKFVLPGQSSDVAIFDVTVPEIENGDYRIFTETENQQAGRID